MASKWEPLVVKSQLRLAAQRLGQLQDRADSRAVITSRDIATLLEQRDVSLARAKAQKLILEEAVSNAMEILEMHCGVILERFADLDKDETNLHSSVIEAISSIIYAATFTDCQDLLLVREMLIRKLGSDFALSAMHNSEGHVSQRILNLMHWKPSASELEDRLQKIARNFNVDWKPQMKMDEKLAILSEVLDTTNLLGTVDLQKLRTISLSGLPSEPQWLRPRVWKILLGTTPVLKVQWDSEAQKKRECYYDLIKRILVTIPALPPPTIPLSESDKNLVAIVESLSRVPPNLFSGLEDPAEQSKLCPLHEHASDEIRISFSFSLDDRLRLIDNDSATDKTNASFDTTPEIRLDVGSPQEAEFDLSKVAQGEPIIQQASTTLSTSNPLSVKSFRNIPAHSSHISALLRLLYMHKALNPAHESPHTASLLVPLYAVMNQEVETVEIAHAEADSFWLFEALLHEVSELEETEGGLVWLKKLHDRLALTDNELLEDLVLKGLDPALPQYSYRWLAPILSHTLPFSSILFAWDSIFSQPEISRGSNPKLEHLVDICTAMLVRARAPLFLLGKSDKKSLGGLWEVESPIVERQQLKPWELGNAFMEGMTLLQNYPIEQVGGMERVLQIAGDILSQRDQINKPAQTVNSGYGAILRDTLWRGFTNNVETTDDSPENSEDSSDEDGNETEHEIVPNSDTSVSQASASGWGSYLKTTVIRGITNQSAMDDSPSPSPIPSPAISATPSPNSSPQGNTEDTSPDASRSHEREDSSSASSSSGIWGYATKLRQSDMAARLSRASTNLSAKALDAWTARSAPAHEVVSFDKKREESLSGTDTARRMAQHTREGPRHGSVPVIDRSEVYSPPPRPAFFKAPRDTRMFSPDEVASLKIPDSPESSSSSSLSTSTISAGHGRAESLMASLPSWANLQPTTPRPKSAPRPLLLSTSSLVATSPSRSANSTPTPDRGQWNDVLNHRVVSPKRQDSQYSQSSVSSRPSSLAPSPKLGPIDWDSDHSVSRKVPLNRQSISPMAPRFRTAHMRRDNSISSQSEFGVLSSRASDSSPKELSTSLADEDSKSARGSSPGSPSTLPSSPPPRTPVASTNQTQSSVRVKNPERQRGSIILSESSLPVLESQPEIKKPSRKAPPKLLGLDDNSDSSAPSASTLSRATSRVRSKRFGSSSSRSSLKTKTREGSSISSPMQASPISIPSPSSLAAPDMDSEAEIATTPKATHFPSTSPTGEGLSRSPRRRKISMEDRERRRKVSGEIGQGRVRKLSSSRRVSGDHRRDSATGHDGDDEGYDELLSAYESEEGSRNGHASSVEA